MTSTGLPRSCRRSFLGLAVLLSSFCAAPRLTAATPAVPPPQVIAEDVVLSDRARVLSEATIEQLVSISPSGQVVFSAATPELEALVPGDVILCSPSPRTPLGFAGRVVAIVDSLGPVVLQTEAAAIGDIITQGRIEVRGSLDPASIDPSTLPEGVTVQADPLSGQIAFHSFDRVLYDVDGDHGTTSDQVKASGWVRLEGGFTLIINGTSDFYVSFQLDETSHVELVGQLDRAFPERRYTFLDVPLGAIPIFWGVAVVPRLQLSVGAHGELHAGFSTSVDQTAGANGWAGLRCGRVGASATSSNHVDPHPLQVTGNLGVEGDLQAKLLFRINDQGDGPWALLEAYIRLEADINQAHWWKLFRGVRGLAGMSGLGQTNLFSPTKELILQENQAPSVDAGGSYTVYEGNSVELAATASDPEGDPLVYSWDLDGNGSFETSGSRATFAAWRRDGPATVIVRARAADNGGEYSEGGRNSARSGEAAASITILNAPPVVGTISASANVPAGSRVMASGSFTDPGVLDTHTAVWDWGDGTTSPGTVVESGGKGSVSGDHAYATPGVYTLKLSVTDDDGATAGSTYAGLVVTPASRASVSGHAWVGTGHAMQRLNLHVQYCPRIGRPKGYVWFYTRLHTRQGNVKVSLWSDSPDGLTVDGHRATVWGRGSLNGKPGYTFQLSLRDGSAAGGNDCFRIRIFGPGAPTAELGGVLTAGNLIVE